MKDTETLITKAPATSGIDMNATDVAASGNQTTLDAWLVDNSDRVYFGNNAYTAMTDLSAGLATLTAGTAAENLTAANISAMKFKALTTAGLEDQADPQWFEWSPLLCHVRQPVGVP